MSTHELTKLFDALGIPTDKPGFYDHPNFIKRERENPLFLESYRQFVALKQFDSHYLDRVRKIVPSLSQYLFDHLQRDGRLGACAGVSSAMSRMLDELGIWNFPTAGGIPIDFPIDSGIGRSGIPVLVAEKVDVTHSWLTAPPFQIVDLTIQAQHWNMGEETILAGFVMEEASNCNPTSEIQVNDLVYTDEFYRLTGQRATIESVCSMRPGLLSEIERHGIWLIEKWGCRLKYIGNATNFSIQPLSQLPFSLCGKSAQQLFDEYIGLHPYVVPKALDEKNE